MFKYSKNKTKQAIEKKQHLVGLNDLLSYLILLDDSTVLHKCDSLSRHFTYIAPDLNSSTDPELDHHAKTWSNTLQMLGNGWMIETNIISTPLKGDKPSRDFPEIVSAILDDERRLQLQQGHYFQSTYILSITYKPEKMLDMKLRHFAVENNNQAPNDTIDEQLTFFNKKVNEVIGYLSRSMKRIEPMRGNELTTFLYKCLTGHNQNLIKPHQGAFLDCYLSGEDFIGGFSPKIGKKFIKALSMDDLPMYSYPAILDALSNLPVAYRWSSRFICLDKPTTQAYLKRFERNWSSKAIGVMGVLRESLGMPAKINPDAQATANAIKDAQTENTAGNIGYGFFNSSLILLDEDQNYLQQVADEITNHIQQLDFKIRNETVNAVECYLGSLPCHGDYNLRKMFVDTIFVSHVLPTSTLYQGESVAPCQYQGYKDAAPLLPTVIDGGRPFFLNLHVGDVGHTAILGPTGSGKSVLNAAIMAAHRQYSGSRIVVLDKDRSNEVIVKALEGNYFVLDENTCQLSPLARLSPNDSTAKTKAISWLKSIFLSQDILLEPQDNQDIYEAIERLSHECSEYKNLNHVSLQSKNLRQALQNFNSGSFQKLLNGTTPSFNNIDVLGFDTGELVKSDGGNDKHTIAVIQAIFDELETIFRDRRPTLLVLEEAWQYLKHDFFAAKLTDWFKTLRKMNVSVIFISQDLSDIIKSDYSSVIQSSCLTRIYLSNNAANEPHIRECYEKFGLNARQIEIIQQSTRKRDYYYSSALGNSLFQLDLGELAKAFLCVNEKDELNTFTKLCNSNNKKWVLDWLEYKGLNNWKVIVEQNYFNEDYR